MAILKALNHSDSKEIIDKAISLPSKVVTVDGRELYITSWKPVVSIDSVITVTLEAVIKMRDTRSE